MKEVQHRETRMARLTSTACTSFLVLVIAGTSQAGGDLELKKAWKRAGRSIKEASVEAGHTVRDTAKSAGHEARVVAKKVGHATREAGEDVSAEGRSFWSDAKHGLAAAFDRFSDALGRLTNDSD